MYMTIMYIHHNVYNVMTTVKLKIGAKTPFLKSHCLNLEQYSLLHQQDSTHYGISFATTEVC